MMIWLSILGALCFGIVVGWITYRTLRRSRLSGINDIAAVIGAVGGAGVTALFRPDTGAFGMYCIGLALGFFGYLVSALVIARKTNTLAAVNEWLGSIPPVGPSLVHQDADEQPPPIHQEADGQSTIHHGV